MQVHAVGQVLNANYSFEAGTTGWNAFGGGTIEQSSVRARCGKHSMLLTSTGATQPRFESNPRIPCTPGQQFRASGWVYVPAAMPSTVSVSVNWYTSTGAYLSTSSNNITLPVGQWVKFDAVYTAPSTAGGAGVLVSCAGTPAAGLQLFADLVTLVPVTSYTASPQAMTVERSVNGISKPQPVGEDVRLAQPTIISL
nr:carbohydrate binding domain-containing protein [Streptomyces sp. SID8377]